MSLGSYVYRKGRPSIGHLIVIPRGILPTLRACHLSVSTHQSNCERQVLLQRCRLHSINCLGYRSYSVTTEAKEAQQDRNDCPTLRPTFSDSLRLPSTANQPAANFGKQPQHIAKKEPSLASPDQALPNELGKHSGYVQQVDRLNRKHRLSREHRDHGRNELRKKGSWSQDWQVPLELLKQHYKPEHKEQAVKGRPRAVWSDSQQIVCQVRVDQIPRPQYWSLVTFRNYVDDLARSTVDRTMRLQIYGAGESHAAAVANELERLFRDTYMTRFLSAKACDTGLAFFYKHGMFAKARALYTRMEDLRIEFEPETFNIILRGAAAQKDLHNYTFHLRHMIKRGFNPNRTTWSCLLMAVDSSEARATIVQAMRAKKLLNRFSTMRDVVKLTIRDEVAKHLESGNQMSPFFSDMDTRYAPGWLSVSAANVVLDEVGVRRPALEAFELLKEIRQRAPALDNVSLNTLLAHCRRSRAHELTIDVLDYFEVEQRLSPGQREYEVLFKQAWKSHLYNFARVIWRSACMEAAVTFKMQKFVMDSLTFKTPEWSKNQPKKRTDIWKATAGKVVVGIDLTTKEDNPDQVQYPDTIFPAIVQNLPAKKDKYSTRLERLMDDTDQRMPHAQVRQSAKGLIHHDLAAFKKYRRKRTLASLLREALATDREWARDNWKDVAVQRKRRNAVVVEVRTTGSAQRFRYVYIPKPATL